MAGTILALKEMREKFIAQKDTAVRKELMRARRELRKSSLAKR